MFLRKTNTQPLPVPASIPRPPRYFNTLVVDDDEFVVKSLPSFLARIPSVNVIGTAHDGRDALDKIKLSQPDIVLMDVRMPRMGGLEATGLILQQFPDVRVVLMSGFDDPAMREECTLAGAHGFLAKMSVTSELPVLLRQLFPAEQAA